MPFTLSHPAAVLPLRRSGLPFAALVCGSMAPDLHMIVPGVSDHLTHRWRAVPTVDLLLGLALLVGWTAILAPPFLAAMPGWVLSRLRAPVRYDRRTWVLAVPGVVVGAATHIAWDTFTHQEMWGGRHVPWLYQVHHGHPGFEWAQYGSSAVGLAVVAGWALWRLRGRAPRAVPTHPRTRSARLALGLPVVLGAMFGVSAAVAAHLAGWRGIDAFVGVLMRSTLVVGTLLGVVGALAWTLWGLVDRSRARTVRASGAGRPGEA